MRIQRVTKQELLDAITRADREWGGCDANTASGAWWALLDAGRVVAYAGIQPGTTHPQYAYMTACAVHPDWRGRGLQRRFLRARKRWAVQHGYEGIITYTMVYNVPSARNLVLEGFLPWRPDHAWVGNECYWLWQPLKTTQG